MCAGTVERHQRERVLPIPCPSHTQARLVIALSAFTCFCNSYDGDFVFDDAEAIVGNKDLRPETPLLQLFKHDFWGSPLNLNSSHKSYRPLTVLTFRLNYLLSGGLDSRGFHLGNILLHTVVCCLFYDVCCLLICHLSAQAQPTSLQRAPEAFLTALLFSVHPVHTEAVAGIVGRADLLCAAFFFLSFSSYMKAFNAALSQSHCKGLKICSWRWVILSVVFSITATLSKEQGITVLGLCIVYDTVAIFRLDLLHPWRSNARNVKGQEFGDFIKRQAVLCMALLAIAHVRWRAMGSGPPAFTPDDNPASFAEGLLVRTINYNYIYALNVCLLLCPWWLCFDWSMGCVPLITSAFDWRIAVPLIFWIILTGFTQQALQGKCERERRLLIMAVALLFLPFLPASNLLFRVGFVVAERLLYLPSAGFSLLVTTGFIRLCQTRPSAQVHYNVGKNWADMGNNTLAVKYYRRAIGLHPHYVQPMNNLGNILKEHNHLIEAEEVLRRAVSIQKDFAAAWMNLGIVQNSLGKTAEAELSYRTALHYRRRYPDCLYNLGRLYLDAQRPTEALAAWREATLLQPDHRMAWHNTVVLFDQLGKLQEAEDAAREALRITPDEPSLCFSIANVLGKQNKYQEAEEFFLKAIQGNLSSAFYHGNLAVLYHRWGKLEEARTQYRLSLELDPSDKGTQDNYAMLLRRMTANADMKT
uniref:protein O-mannosyl-transferase TMTC4 isoform X2 n=1 Tax=Myxine glutinosa TaxID=7769 RepID=UPI00358E525E